MSQNETLPPPPPPTQVPLSEVQRIEQMVEELCNEMHGTNVRRRFKMVVYENWCNRADAIRDALRKLRGAS